MATKQEIIAALDAVAGRLDALEPRIRLSLEKPLLTGSWTVHDAVCHLAADANAIPGFVERAERVAQGLPGRVAGFSMDESNQRNIDLRKPKLLDDVFAEIRAGFSADRARVPSLDDALLAREQANARGEVGLVSDQLRGYVTGHPNGHLNDIEAALEAGVHA